MDTTLLNQGLELAMAWGQNWMSPIQERLAAVRPELSREELDGLDRVARAAMKQGHDLVPVCFREASGVQKEAYILFRKRLLADLPWVSEAMASRLFSQGCYYAWKDGNMP